MYGMKVNDNNKHLSTNKVQGQERHQRKARYWPVSRSSWASWEGKPTGCAGVYYLSIVTFLRARTIPSTSEESSHCTKQRTVPSRALSLNKYQDGIIYKKGKTEPQFQGCISKYWAETFCHHQGTLTALLTHRPESHSLSPVGITELCFLSKPCLIAQVKIDGSGSMCPAWDSSKQLTASLRSVGPGSCDN